MSTHRINEDVEKRLSDWVKSKPYLEQLNKVWGLTFNEALDNLLREAGF